MKRLNVANVWGSGNGVLRSVQPHARILAGMLLLVACLASAPEKLSHLLLLLLVVGVWIAGSGMSRRLIGPLLLYALIAFLPFFALVPWIEPAPGSGQLAAFQVPWRILVKGTGGVFIAVATAAATPQADLYAGLARLPLPRLVVLIVIQIVHQGTILVHETTGIARALNLRGAGPGMWSGLRLVRALPGVWLPRVFFRAERVAAAMQVRGYGLIPPKERPVLRLRDVLVPLLAAACLAAVIADRIASGLAV